MNQEGLAIILVILAVVFLVYRATRKRKKTGGKGDCSNC